MFPGRPYLMKIGASTVNATITRPKYRIDVNTLMHEAATGLKLNEIGVCNISLDRAIPFDPYDENRETGGFILIDKISNATVGVGMIHFAAAPVVERALAGDGCRADDPCGGQGPETGRALVHGAFRIRQIDDRQYR